MNKIQKFALTLSIVLAAALTFSCSSDSSDDDDNVGGGSINNLPDLTNQVYLFEGYNKDKEEYNGSGDVVLVFYKWNDDGEFLYRDTLPAGKIQYGKLTLDLPNNVDSKYLENLSCYLLNAFECDVSKNISATDMFYLFVINRSNNTPDKNYICNIYIGENPEKKDSWTELYYFSDSGKASGIAWKYIDWNFSKGWNVIYNAEIEDDYESSTDPSIMTGTLVWSMECEENKKDWN